MVYNVPFCLIMVYSRLWIFLGHPRMKSCDTTAHTDIFDVKAGQFLHQACPTQSMNIQSPGGFVSDCHRYSTSLLRGVPITPFSAHHDSALLKEDQRPTGRSEGSYLCVGCGARADVLRSVQMEVIADLGDTIWRSWWFDEDLQARWLEAGDRVVWQGCACHFVSEGASVGKEARRASHIGRPNLLHGWHWGPSGVGRATSADWHPAWRQLHGCGQNLPFQLVRQKVLTDVVHWRWYALVEFLGASCDMRQGPWSWLFWIGYLSDLQSSSKFNLTSSMLRFFSNTFNTICLRRIFQRDSKSKNRSFLPQKFLPVII